MTASEMAYCTALLFITEYIELLHYILYLHSYSTHPLSFVFLDVQTIMFLPPIKAKEYYKIDYPNWRTIRGPFPETF